MTEQPDTAAIRAILERENVEHSPVWDIVWEVIDALDAARAERDQADAHSTYMDELMTTHHLELREATNHAKAAEARIAAALALCDLAEEKRQLRGWASTERVRRALTGDTE